MYLVLGLDRLLWRVVVIETQEVEVPERMALAIYVHSRFPELTIKEVFQALDDPVFLVILLEVLREVCND
jgi:hypothetical protein